MTLERPTKTATLGPIRLLNAGLNERNGEIIAHGWLDLEGMGLLKIGSYQREVLAKIGGKKTSLQKAVENGVRLPDIMVGMRGQNFDGKSTMLLNDPCYIVDGLQRISALKRYAEEHPELAKDLRIGAEVRFDTTEASEKDLFLILNTSRIPVSPNVILRCTRDKHPALQTLYGISCGGDKSFALHGKVQWNQRMLKGELITALMLCKTALHLMCFDRSPRSERAERMGEALDAISKPISLMTFRENIKTFFDVIDECWPSRNVEYRDRAVQLKGNFLFALALLFAQHTNFWKPGHKLFVDAPSKKKLMTFKIQDLEIQRLAASGTQALPILYNYLLEHFNKGKRDVGRLRKRSED